MSDEIISLRTESISAQAMRFDLAKFKLIATAVLGSIAVGAGTTAGTEKFPYVVGLIPLVCIYIDLIADSKRIQILVIGAFLKTREAGVFADYEKFCSELRTKRNIFAESYAFSSATNFLCLAIFLFGVLQLIFIENVARTELWIEILSGTLGLVISLLLHRNTKKRVSQIP